MTSHTIAIIGAGNVGATLGRRFAEAGHQVVFALRNPDDAKYASLDGERRSRDTIANATARAGVVLLATPWAATQDALRAAGDLTGKTLIDATNPIGPGMVLTHGTNDSGAEQVSRWSPGAHVVKAFASVGAEVMARPRYGTPEAPQHALLLLCGDHESSCDVVAQLATDIDFAPLRLGPLARARIIEPAALLWITATAPLGSRDFAFGLLRRE